MPRVKIVEVHNHYSEEIEATQRDIKELTGWEDISAEDMIHLRHWVVYGARVDPYAYRRRDTNYAILVDPEVKISAINSVKEVVDAYKAAQEKAAKKREEAAKRARETALERKKKQLEKLKKELGE